MEFENSMHYFKKLWFKVLIQIVYFVFSKEKV